MKPVALVTGSSRGIGAAIAAALSAAGWAVCRSSKSLIRDCSSRYGFSVRGYSRNPVALPIPSRPFQIGQIFVGDHRPELGQPGVEIPQDLFDLPGTGGLFVHHQQAFELPG